LDSGPTSSIDETRRRLGGLWEREAHPPCAVDYPARIEFTAPTRFRAMRGAGQRYICWDVGGYEVIAEDRIRIQTAWDEFVQYTFSLSADVLSFVDSTGCGFRYRRIQVATDAGG
jgi:hypothetical protein